MKLRIAFVSLVTFLSFTLHVNAQSLETRYLFDVGSGYRQDHLDWSISGPNGVPNILSELTWRDIEIFQVSATLRAIFCQNYYVRLQGDYGWIFEGNNQDSDYNGNHRTLEFSRSNNSGDNGNVYDVSIGTGRFFQLCTYHFTFAPLVGYSLHGQELHISNGVQTVASDPADLGPLLGLNSTYKTQWFGPWIGLDVCGDIAEQWQVFADYEFHFAKYEARGHWNLRSDFIDDFTHDAYGFGHIVNLGTRYDLNDQWFVGVGFKYQTWKARHGRDRTYFLVDLINDQNELVGVLPAASDTILNRVRWQSFSVALKLGCHF